MRRNENRRLVLFFGLSAVHFASHHMRDLSRGFHLGSMSLDDATKTEYSHGPDPFAGFAIGFPAGLMVSWISMLLKKIAARWQMQKTSLGSI